MCACLSLLAVARSTNAGMISLRLVTLSMLLAADRVLVADASAAAQQEVSGGVRMRIVFVSLK